MIINKLNNAHALDVWAKFESEARSFTHSGMTVKLKLLSVLTVR
jgi:hypothetical protein